MNNKQLKRGLVIHRVFFYFYILESDRQTTVRKTLILYCLMALPAPLVARSATLGWTGDTLIPPEEFHAPENWIVNTSGQNTCELIPNDSCLSFRWKLDAGPDQWVQCYYVFDTPVSLGRYDIFGYDIHGSPCETGTTCHKEHVLEIKFEDGIRHATYTRYGEEGILGVDRWVGNQFFSRYGDAFSIPEDFDWDHITVFSIAVKSHPWISESRADSGTVSFHVLRADSSGSWTVPGQLETLTTPSPVLDSVRQNALDFILSRQQATGLFTTWTEDGLSWLYGQGLVLKILSIEGIWIDGEPVNEPAEAAESLAQFLAGQIQEEGYWPRAWNSYNGEVVFLYEQDGSIWMGDFPWMLTGLMSYYKKSGDCSVVAAIKKGTAFLESLVRDDGSFYTLNVLTGNQVQVTSSEAYAAALGALFELGRTDMAEKMINRVDDDTWDHDLMYWHEGNYSDRVVLFCNTWLSMLLHDRGYEEKARHALNLVGRLLYTCGPGNPCGLDGIGPIAVWYEGVLSYIAAGGPGSNALFEDLQDFIQYDGSVPHYNDNIGGTAGIWAETWHSLDGTSWLYNVAAAITPFDTLQGFDPDLCADDYTGSPEELPGLQVYPSPFTDWLRIIPDSGNPISLIEVYQICGEKVYYREYIPTEEPLEIHLDHIPDGLYILKVGGRQLYNVKMIPKVH